MAVVVKETVSAPVAATVHGSYVDWAAIIAGTVLAVAISTIFLTFGSAIGLSLTSPFSNEGWSLAAVMIAMGLWLIWVQISASVGGGYLAGRMLRRRAEISDHENEIRDGSHGVLVWAAATIVAGLIAALTATGAIKAGGAVAISAADKAGYYADVLLRTENTTPPLATLEPARAEIGRILSAGALQGDITPADRAQLVRVISVATGLPAAEVQTRVDQFVTEAKATAEKARKTAIIAAFVAAASLLISALAAFWAAVTGGNHRDANTVFRRIVWWRNAETIR
jgi:hypothetical protein